MTIRRYRHDLLIDLTLHPIPTYAPPATSPTGSIIYCLSPACRRVAAFYLPPPPSSFVIRTSFVIGHSSFVLPLRPLFLPHLQDELRPLIKPLPIRLNQRPTMIQKVCQNLPIRIPPTIIHIPLRQAQRHDKP